MAEIDESKVNEVKPPVVEPKQADNKADDENTRLKAALSKANSEAAEWRRKYSATLDEAKRKEMEAEERRKAELEELESLRRDKRINSYKAKLMDAQDGWRKVCAAAMLHGVPVPAMSAALSYYDGYRCERLPANLLQAQRDYFGAHTYERLDHPRGEFFHTNWTGHGGSTSASTYSI